MEKETPVDERSKAIRITPQRQDIPAAAAATELCPTLRIELESDDETDDDEAVTTTEAAGINGQQQAQPTPRGKTPATVLDVRNAVGERRF
eukprot:scaffold33252_cov61-Phaeocystis_antarctica.AAC.4